MTLFHPFARRKGKPPSVWEEGGSGGTHHFPYRTGMSIVRGSGYLRTPTVQTHLGLRELCFSTGTVGWWEWHPTVSQAGSGLSIFRGCRRRRLRFVWDGS